jgi:hypothetical protein
MQNKSSIKITVPPEIAAFGITLLPATSPEVREQVAAILREDAAMMRPLLPYAVVLVNKGSSRILTTTVGFEWFDKEGHRKMPIFGIADLVASHPSQIGPGQARLFAPQHGLNLNLAQPEETRVALSPSWGDIVAHVATDASNGHNMRAFIDSVTIEGVGLVGPDKSRRRGSNWDVKTTTY